jgi:hypothetical protein
MMRVRLNLNGPVLFAASATLVVFDEPWFAGLFFVAGFLAFVSER